MEGFVCTKYIEYFSGSGLVDKSFLESCRRLDQSIFSGPTSLQLKKISICGFTSRGFTNNIFHFINLIVQHNGLFKDCYSAE